MKTIKLTDERRAKLKSKFDIDATHEQIEIVDIPFIGQCERSTYITINE
jgi:hypothetical protein